MSRLPSAYAELVSGLQSDSVDAPRNLSALLVSRLWEMSDQHMYIFSIYIFLVIYIYIIFYICSILYVASMSARV